MKDKTEEKLIKKMEGLKPYLDFYGQFPTLTKSNEEQFMEYIELKAKLQQHRETKKEILDNIKQIMYSKIDWIRVFRDAYESRKTSWVEIGHIQEWRNATDEVLFAVWRQLDEELKKEIKGEK